MALKPNSALLAWGGQPTPGLSPARLAAGVQALAYNQAFAAAIAAWVFAIPASAAAEMEDNF